ncbi:MAG: hypothetical protein WDO06_02530 [Actinomycetota bacterium]
MISQRNSKIAKFAVIITVLGVVAANGSIASAASKSITCYKGTATKKVTSAKPVCPKGWSAKKPVVKVTPKATPTPSATPKASPTPTASSKPSSNTVSFNGMYKGKIALVWSGSDVQATSVSGNGSGDIEGLEDLTGTGSSAPASQCDSIDGVGTLSGGGSTLKVTFDSTAKGCAEDGAAPTVVHLTGSAVINGGTGKFAGASGTLKAVGTFSIKSTEAGTSESTSFTLTLTGDIKTK